LGGWEAKHFAVCGKKRKTLKLKEKGREKKPRRGADKKVPLYADTMQNHPRSGGKEIFLHVTRVTKLRTR